MKKKFFKHIGVTGSALMAVAILLGSFMPTVTVNGAVASYVLLPNGQTNTLNNVAPLFINSVTLTANTTNTSILGFDSPTNTLGLSVGAYTNVTYSITNIVTSWTNFYGVANSYTNKSLIWTTNSISSSTRLWARPVTVSALTGVTATVSIDYLALNGLLLTNNSTGTATITVDYNTQ